MSWLRNTKHSWLLILDNADDTDVDLATFLPAGKKGSILITTRNPQCVRHQTVGEDAYEGLDRKVAIELLLKACGINMSLRIAHEADADAVAELLGYHALAIIVAGAAVSEGYCKLEKYKEIFLDERETLFKCFPKQAKSRYGDVNATFEVSASYLKSFGTSAAQDALQLLNFYASMHFTDFPETAFEEAWKNSRDKDVVSSFVFPDGTESIRNLAAWHVSHLPIFMQPNLRGIDLDMMRIVRARSLLVDLSLVTFDSNRSTTRMHPVTHFWARDRLSQPEEFAESRLNGVSVLSLFIKDTFVGHMSPSLRHLQLHIESITKSLKEWGSYRGNFNIQQSLYRFSCAMFFLTRVPELFELLQMIPIQEDESWIKNENNQNIQILHSRSMRDFGDAGDANKAVVLLEQVNEARAQTAAADDSKSLSVQHGLAIAYMKIGKTDKAIEMLKQIIELKIANFSPEHPDSLASQHELARAYLYINETDKAITLLKNVMELRTRTLNPKIPDLLASMHVLAMAYIQNGDTDQAITLLERVVEIEKMLWNPEHQNLLGSQHELARAYLDGNETAKAMALLEVVVEITMKNLMPEHPDLLASQHVLARAYLQNGDTAQAISLLESVVEIEAETLREDDPERVKSVCLLAQCFRQAKDYERALQLARSIENVARNMPGEDLADYNTELISYILEAMDRERYAMSPETESASVVIETEHRPPEQTRPNGRKRDLARRLLGPFIQASGRDTQGTA